MQIPPPVAPEAAQPRPQTAPVPLAGPLLEAYQAHKYGSEKLQAMHAEALKLLSKMGDEGEAARKKFWDLAAQALGYADADAVHKAGFGMQVKDGVLLLLIPNQPAFGNVVNVGDGLAAAVLGSMLK